MGTGELDGKRARRAWPVSAYLIALALAISLPITACAAFLAYHFVSESSQLARTEYEDRLRLMRNATELRLANIIEDLQVLALSPSLRDGDFAAFRQHALDAAQLMGAVAVVLYDSDGQQLANSRLAPDQPLPRRAEFETERRAIETGQPQVSGLQKAVVDGQPVVIIAVPVCIDGQIRYALNVGFSPSYLSGLMDEYLSEGLVGSIIDAKGILIARRPLVDGAELIGEPTIPEVRAHVGERAAFWIKAVSRTGVPTYSSLLRSNQSGWSVNIGVPRQFVDGPLRRTVEWIAATALLSFLLSLLVARLFATRFLTAFAGLEHHVMNLRTRIEPPAAGPVAEVNRMQRVLYHVAQDILRAEHAVERERSMLRATVDSLPIGVLLASPSGKVTLVNERMLSIWGIDRLDRIDDPQRLSGLRDDGTPYAPEELPIARALHQRVVTEGEEVVRVVHGVRRHIMMTAVPVHGADGETIAAVCACYDVTELRTALKQQKGLLDEINHRVKNTLGTVQSMARLSRASSQTLQEYAASFEGRLLALSEAYNLLTENNWVGASLQAVVSRTLAPFAGPDRLEISGPPLLLAAKAALALSAAVQELSTNAAKYGALSAAAGRVSASWSVGEDGMVQLVWTERGGPIVQPPSRRGFGTKMIEAIFRNEPGWDVKLEFEPAGLRCIMQFWPHGADIVHDVRLAPKLRQQGRTGG